MSKKKIALTLCAVALTGVLAVGGSLAYFTDETEKVTNVFTTNDKELSGKIVESFDEDKAESFLPGDAIYKEPVLNNDADSIKAWAAIKVDILIDDQVVSYNDFKNNYAVISYLENEGFNLNDFELIQGDYNSSASLVFAYKNIIAPGSSSTPIFDNVDVNMGIKTVVSSKYKNKEIYREVEEQCENAVQFEDGKWYVLVESGREVYDNNTNYYLKNENGELQAISVDYELPKFEIKVQGYMIQAENVDYNTAKSELIAFVGNNSDN